MNRIAHRRRPILAALLVWVAAFFTLCTVSMVQASSYEAPLPVELRTDPDLCKWVPCRDVLPGADHFSPRMGRPSYV